MNKPKVLILDDQRASRALITHALGSMCELHITENADDALALTEKHAYDFAHLDVMLKTDSMDGPAVAKIMRKSGKKTPVGFLSASPKQELGQKTRKCLESLDNIKFYAIKPIIPQDLRQLIFDALKKQS